MGWGLLLTKGKLTCTNSRVFAQTNSITELARMSDVTAEASARSAADNNLQNQINTHTSQIASLNAATCEIRTGTYIGNGTSFPNSQAINLGFRPKAVLILHYGFIIERGFNSLSYNPYGGLVIDGWSNGSIKITNSGFEVYGVECPPEAPDISYCYLNEQGYTYVYLAFK